MSGHVCACALDGSVPRPRPGVVLHTRACTRHCLARTDMQGNNHEPKWRHLRAHLAARRRPRHPPSNAHELVDLALPSAGFLRHAAFAGSSMVALCVLVRSISSYGARLAARRRPRHTHSTAHVLAELPPPSEDSLRQAALHVAPWRPCVCCRTVAASVGRVWPRSAPAAHPLHSLEGACARPRRRPHLPPRPRAR